MGWLTGWREQGVKNDSVSCWAKGDRVNKNHGSGQKVRERAEVRQKDGEFVPVLLQVVMVTPMKCPLGS